MSPIRILGLIVALGAAGMAALLLGGFFGGKSKAVAAAGPAVEMAEVLVAARDIDVGHHHVDEAADRQFADAAGQVFAADEGRDAGLFERALEQVRVDDVRRPVDDLHGPPSGGCAPRHATGSRRARQTPDARYDRGQPAAAAAGPGNGVATRTVAGRGQGRSARDGQGTDPVLSRDLSA